MQVNIIDHTQNAVNLLLYTKETRLNQGAETREEIANWPEEKKLEALNYMSRTIPSSWEFVSYTFELLGVSRAFTHQLVRTRNASYAQQTQRMVKMDKFRFVTGTTILENTPEGQQRNAIYCETMARIQEGYDALIAMGARVEDARGLLPTNIETNIIVKLSLRTLAEMARSRTGRRTQGEYRAVMEFMLAAVLAVHPWARSFLFPDLLMAVQRIEGQLARLPQTEQSVVDALKALDQIRKEI